jgi:hypothetical protein
MRPLNNPSRDRKGAVLRCAIALLALTAAAIWAQEQPIFRSDTRLVVCHVTVVDKNGHFVTNLPQDAFTVFENGAPQPIKIFRREDVPVSLGLIIDNSGSMRDKRTKVEAAALALVKDSNPDDEVFVVNFNDEAFLDNPHGKAFTSDIKEMEEALTRIDSRGGTAMRDAIRMSIDHLKEKAHKDKKVLVTVTDGNDNASVVSLENLVKSIRSPTRWPRTYAASTLSNIRRPTRRWTAHSARSKLRSKPRAIPQFVRAAAITQPRTRPVHLLPEEKGQFQNNNAFHPTLSSYDGRANGPAGAR